jgi:hypothetical protein
MMADYGLEFSFGIDDGELDDCTRPECFVLGYELAHINALLGFSPAISSPVHSANADRIKRLCEKWKRPCSITWMVGDASEDWMQLEIPSTPGPQA